MMMCGPAIRTNYAMPTALKLGRIPFSTDADLDKAQASFNTFIEDSLGRGLTWGKHPLR
jgi:hypothetical protein